MSAAILDPVDTARASAARDLHGNPMTASDPRCVSGYARALRAFNCYRGDPVVLIDETLEHDADFAMGIILRAHVHISLWERSVLPELAAMVRRLVALAPRLTDREQRHVTAIRQWSDGDWDGMRTTLEKLSARYPRDLLALQVGHLADFFHGDRDNLRGRIARALPAWSPEDEHYAFLLGMHAFGLEECGLYAQAEETGRHALALEPEDCWAHHAVAHVLEMQDRQLEGIAFMHSRQAYWAQPDNGFAFHNWWHKALYHLDHGEVDEVLTIYDRVRAGVTPIQMYMLDAVALLWRMHLRRIDVGERWQQLAGDYLASGEAGFYAFNDVHAVMALVATGAVAQAEAWLAAMTAAARAAGSNGVMTRAVGLPIARAVIAFGRGEYVQAIEELLPVRHRAHAFGGSHAQRDIVHRTLIEAALRAGDKPLATALTNDRLALRPASPFSLELRRRAQAL